MDEDDAKKYEELAVDEPQEDVQADPDEIFQIDGKQGTIWCVKMPKQVLARFSEAAQAARPGEKPTLLGHFRCWNQGTGKERVALILPEQPRLDAQGNEVWENGKRVMDKEIYELEITNRDVRNQFVFGEKEKETPFKAEASGSVNGAAANRERDTNLVGKVIHECNLKPILTSAYRDRIRNRNKEANRPKRTIQKMEDNITERGTLNMLASGVSGTRGNSTFTTMPSRLAKDKGKGAERFARIAKDQLLDLLFAAFKEKDWWSLKELRARTQQPEVYLKEVLGEIAYLQRSGEKNGMYGLQEAFADRGPKPDPGVVPPPGAYGSAPPAVKSELQYSSGLEEEDDDMDEDDDDDDDDMDQIA